MEHGSPRKFPRSSWPGSRVIKAALLASVGFSLSLSLLLVGGRRLVVAGKYEKIMFEQPAKYLTKMFQLENTMLLEDKICKSGSSRVALGLDGRDIISMIEFSRAVVYLSQIARSSV